MRLALLGRDPASAPLVRAFFLLTFLAGSASKFPQPRMPDEYRNHDPLGRSLETQCYKKTPLMQPTREEIASVQYLKHRLPQARCRPAH
jgi:hypothetical protein